MIATLMTFVTFKNLVFFTGLVHFCQVPALMFAPKMLNWREDLAKLLPINRHIVVALGSSITYIILGTGIMVMATSSELAAGGRLAAGVDAFLAALWTYRLWMQIFIYPKIWPGGWLGRASYWILVAIFVYLASAYSVFLILAV